MKQIAGELRVDFVEGSVAHRLRFGGGRGRGQDLAKAMGLRAGKTPMIVDATAGLAIKHARKRVVLKWPAKADPIEGVKKCTHQIIGKTMRYDVFMTG